MSTQFVKHSDPLFFFSLIDDIPIMWLFHYPSQAKNFTEVETEPTPFTHKF